MIDLPTFCFKCNVCETSGLQHGPGSPGPETDFLYCVRPEGYKSVESINLSLFLVAPPQRAERLIWSLWCLCVSTFVLLFVTLFACLYMDTEEI